MNFPLIQPPLLAKLAIAYFAMLLLPAMSHARDVVFAWDASPEPITGYKLYYKTGTDSGPPYNGTGLNDGNDSPISLGKVTTATVTGLSADETYQFTLTAYTETGESDYATEVPVQAVTFPSPTINIMSQN